MNLTINPYSLALFVSAITALVIAIITWRRRSAPGALPLFIMLVTTVLWAGANGFLLETTTPSGRLFWFNILSVGALGGTPALLAFALQYTGRESWLTRRNVILLSLIPVISVLLTWTNAAHHLFYTEIDFTAAQPSGGWRATPGIGYNIFLAYSYPLVLYGIAIVAQAFFRSPRTYRGQAGAILIGTLIPLIGNIAYNIISSGSIKGWVDPTPILFTAMGIFYAYGLFAFRLFDIVPVARHTLVERMRDGMLVIDSHNRIIDINPAALHLLGLTSHSPIGLTTDHLAFSIPESAPSQTEITLDGESRRHINLQIEPLLDGQNQLRGRLIVARDVTERRLIESHREQLITELEAKNSELARFTYAVSHDLKSPLITVKGFLGLLKEDLAAGNASRIQSDIQRMSGAIDIMHKRLEDLLELSRAGQLTDKPEVLRFNDLVAETLELVHGRISQRGITVRVDANLPSITGDHDRLLGVIQNLIDNACKFMGDQPEPQIKIGQHGEDAESRQPILFVKDNGIGIAPEYHDRIFGLFNKLEAKSEGTGIGLTLVKRIIEVHGGRIWIKSEVGQGSTFYFTLPRG